MRISYNPLWKMLIDKGMNKKELRELSGISTASMAKLGKGENITTDLQKQNNLKASIRNGWCFFHAWRNLGFFMPIFTEGGIDRG